MNYSKYVKLYDKITIWDSERPKVFAVSTIIYFIIFLVIILFTCIITNYDIEAWTVGLFAFNILLFLSIGTDTIIGYTFFCGLFSYPFRYKKVRRLIMSGKCCDRKDAGILLLHYAYNGKDEHLLGHKWKCDTCERCGKTREVYFSYWGHKGGHESNKEDERVCKYCGVDIKEWNEYARNRCGGYDKSHDWKKCACKRCGITRHEWNGCICKRCGKESHNWRKERDNGDFFTDDFRCTNCGAESNGIYIGPSP